MAVFPRIRGLLGQQEKVLFSMWLFLRLRGIQGCAIAPQALAKMRPTEIPRNRDNCGLITRDYCTSITSADFTHFIRFLVRQRRFRIFIWHGERRIAARNFITGTACAGRGRLKAICFVEKIWSEPRREQEPFGRYSLRCSGNWASPDQLWRLRTVHGIEKRKKETGETLMGGMP